LKLIAFALALVVILVSKLIPSISSTNFLASSIGTSFTAKLDKFSGEVFVRKNPSHN
jgi:hypothetical protein